jgi:hypothetical protein
MFTKAVLVTVPSICKLGIATIDTSAMICTLYRFTCTSSLDQQIDSHQHFFTNCEIIVRSFTPGYFVFPSWASAV